MSPISRELLNKYIEGECSSEEEEFVHRWLDENDLDEYLPADRQRKVGRKERRNWRFLTEQLGELKPMAEGLAAGRRFRYVRPLAAVVAALVLLGAGLLLYREVRRSRFTYKTDFGEIKRINLADGTIVTLNARSVLRIPENFAKQGRRSVYLKGEAYFQVKHQPDHPFNVYVQQPGKRNQVTVTALGTSFDVSAFSDDPKIAVALSEGKVMVKSGNTEGTQQVVLRPGELAVFNKSSSKLVVENRFNKKEAMAWQVQDIYFKNADIGDVLRKLERFYGVSFDTGYLKPRHWQLSGEYKNQTLKDVLESLSFNYNLQYDIKGDVVTLSDE